MSTVSQLRKKILNGEIDLRSFYDDVLAQAGEAQKKFNCFITIAGSSVTERLGQLESGRKNGKPGGKLFGIPIVVKDNICLKGHPTTCASKILTDFSSPYNATVVDRLLEEDAVIIGKANMDEFAMGSSNENSSFGAVLNPHDKARIPGGSSGGSAASVAAKVVPIALGSDTGGSIRQPAAMCGVVGLKPTYGSISRYGLVAFSSSMDQIGPLAADVESAAILFDVISGHDQRDSTSANFTKTDSMGQITMGVKGVRIGLPQEYFAEGLDDQIREQIELVIGNLKDQGADVVSVTLPLTKYAISVYYILANAEASSNLARYDGVRYGLREKSADLGTMYTLTRHAGFGAEVTRRILLGTYVLSAGYYDAYYQKAMRVRAKLANDFQRVFQSVDLLLTPTTPTTAFKLGEKIDDPISMYLSDIYTVSANLAGIPAISIPCGTDKAQLPIGVQLMAKHFDETKLFQVGSTIEQMTK